MRPVTGTATPPGCCAVHTLGRFYRGWVLSYCAWSREDSTRHFHTPMHGAVKVHGHCPVSRLWLIMGGVLWRDTYRIRRLRTRNHDVQALYLSAGFGDFGRLAWCVRGGRDGRAIYVFLWGEHSGFKKWFVRMMHTIHLCSMELMQRYLYIVQIAHTHVHITHTHVIMAANV